MFWHDFDVIIAELHHHCQFRAVTQCAFGETYYLRPPFLKDRFK
jgi:hypothetical protein